MKNLIKQKKSSEYILVVSFILLFTIIIWFMHYQKSFSIPNSTISKICEEKVLEGMTKQEVFKILDESNFQSEVKENEATSFHLFFSYQGRNPMIWDYETYISFKDNKVVDKDCFWGF